MNLQNLDIPLIAILRGIEPHQICEHLPILIEAGFEAIEIPLNSPNWQKSIEIAVEKYGQKTLIGAGTVINVNQVKEVADIGGRLIVTPNTDEKVINEAVNLNLNICSGCATATEAFKAIDAGSEHLKIFPSSAFGPNYIKALKAVLPRYVEVYAVGGITPDNLYEYISAGCRGAGLGGDLYKPNQSTDVTRQKANLFVNAYNDIVKKEK